MHPLITVIVVVYNIENYVRRCLDSVLYQTYDNLQIIIVDDGSTDSSGMICDEYAQKNGKIQIIHTDNNGQAAARLAGFEYANGDYTSFIDGDDWLEPQMYRVMIETIQNNDICIVGHYIAYSNHKIIAEFRPRPGVYTGEKLDKEIKSKLFWNGEQSEIYGYLWQKLFKTELIRANMRYSSRDIYFGEDLLLSGSCMLDAESVVVSSEILYNYYQRVDSITKVYDSRFFDNVLRLYQQLSFIFEEKKVLSFNRQKELYFLKLIVEVVKSICKHRQLSLRKKLQLVEAICDNAYVGKTLKCNFSNFYWHDRRRVIYLLLIKYKLPFLIWLKVKLKSIK